LTIFCDTPGNTSVTAVKSTVVELRIFLSCCPLLRQLVMFNPPLS